MLHRKEKRKFLFAICIILTSSVCLAVNSMQTKQEEITTIATLPDELDASQVVSRERIERMERLSRFQPCFTLIYENSTEGIEVLKYVDENDYQDNPTDAGYGVVVVRNGREYRFPKVHYGKIGQAYMYEQEPYLYLCGDDVSGTEMLRQRLYVFDISGDDVKLAAEISPSDVTAELTDHMKAYGDKKAHTVSLHDSDGKIFTSEYIDNYDEIEGINYDMHIEYIFDAQVKVKLWPGLKFCDQSMYSFEQLEPIEYHMLLQYEGDEKKITLVKNVGLFLGYETDRK